MCRWDITGKKKMKKSALFFSFLLSLFIINNTFAQQRTKISEGVYVVSYGDTYVIEDDINQISVNMKIQQEKIDDRNNEIMYNVICGKWSRRVTSFALGEAIKEGVKYAVPTGGTSLIPAAAAAVSKWIYEDACNYWEKHR